jgi:putative transposase
MADVRTLPVGTGSEERRVTLDELAREGARRMIAAALESEVEEYVSSFTDELDEEGKRQVVRNGHARERKLTVGSGTVAVRAPRVNDQRIDERSGERRRFSSRILPKYARRSPKVTEVLPILYLHGLSTGDFGPALRDLLGEDAAGLSPSSIQRLTESWQAEHEAFRKRSLCFRRHAYWFLDGVHVSVRLGEDERLCLLVVIGVREDGSKELLAVEDGYRESTESWASVMRDLKARGANEPKLVVGEARSARGRRCGMCSRPRAGRHAGCTRSPTCSTACPSGCSPKRRACCTRSWRRPRAPRPSWRSSACATSSAPSTPRRSRSSTATGST